MQTFKNLIESSLLFFIYLYHFVSQKESKMIISIMAQLKFDAEIEKKALNRNSLYSYCKLSFCTDHGEKYICIFVYIYKEITFINQKVCFYCNGKISLAKLIFCLQNLSRKKLHILKCEVACIIPFRELVDFTLYEDKRMLFVHVCYKAVTSVFHKTSDIL